MSVFNFTRPSSVSSSLSPPSYTISNSSESEWSSIEDESGSHEIIEESKPLTLREIQMQNPRFRARLEEHERKQEEERQLLEYKEDRILYIKNSVNEFDSALENALISLNRLAQQTNYLGDSYLVLSVIQPIKNDTIPRMKASYEDYLLQMNLIQERFNAETRTQVENNGKYDDHFKEGFSSLSTNIYNTFQTLQGVNDNKIRLTLEQIFTILSNYGAPPIELETEQSNIDQETIQILIDNYRQMGYNNDAIIDTMMTVYNIDPNITMALL